MSNPYAMDPGRSTILGLVSPKTLAVFTGTRTAYYGTATAAFRELKRCQPGAMEEALARPYAEVEAEIKSDLERTIDSLYRMRQA